MKEPTEDEILQAFRSCARIDTNKAEELSPDVVAVCQMVGSCLAVHWVWVLLALLTLVGGLIPQDRFETAPSIELPSSLWVVLLHPGATNTSGIIQIITRAISMLMQNM
jgi:hypothetical protein